MSVKEAASRLGVGRPALSNLLNGNAALSPDMAVRLEKSFGADRQKLLDMQAAADRVRQAAAVNLIASWQQAQGRLKTCCVVFELRSLRTGNLHRFAQTYV